MNRFFAAPGVTALLMLSCTPATADIATFSRSMNGTPPPAQHVARNRFVELTKPISKAKSGILEVVSTSTVVRDHKEEMQYAHGWLYFQPPDHMRWVLQSNESTVTVVRAGNDLLSIAPSLQMHSMDKDTRPLSADLQEAVRPIDPTLPLLFERWLDESVARQFFDTFEQAPADSVSRIPGESFIGRKVNAFTSIYTDNRMYGLPVLIETRPSEFSPPASEVALRWWLDVPLPANVFAIERPAQSREVAKLPPQVVRIPIGVGSPQFEDSNVHSAIAAAHGTLGPAPNFALPTNNGGNFNLASQRGNVVVLDFFATWCGPCRANMPHVAQLTQGLASQGVVFAPVNVGEDVAAVQKFLSDTKVSASVVMDSAQTAASKFKIRAFPTYVIVDRSGYIRANHAGNSDAVAAEIQTALSAR